MFSSCLFLKLFCEGPGPGKARKPQHRKLRRNALMQANESGPGDSTSLAPNFRDLLGSSGHSGMQARTASGLILVSVAVLEPWALSLFICWYQALPRTDRLRRHSNPHITSRVRDESREGLPQGHCQARWGRLGCTESRSYILAKLTNL